MPIEFRCTGCDRLLRVEDDDAGKQAKCPECGQIAQIPGLSAPSLQSGSDAADRLADDSGNPFQSPATGAFGPDDATETLAAAARLVPTRVRLTDVLQRTWALYTSHLRLCLLFSLVLGGLFAAIAILVSAAILGLMMLDALGASVNAVVMVSIPIAVVAWFGLALGAVWIQCGQTIFMIHLARGQRATLGDLFAGGPYVLRAIGVNSITAAILLPLALLCAVPFVIMEAKTVGPLLVNTVMYVGSLFLILALYFVIDRNMSVFASLRSSVLYMRGNKLAAFLVHLIVGGGSILLLCATLGFASLFILPFFFLALAVFYTAATGQLPASADGAEPPSR